MVDEPATGIPQRHKGHKEIKTSCEQVCHTLVSFLHSSSLSQGMAYLFAAQSLTLCGLCVFVGYKHPYLAGVSRYYSYMNTAKEILSLYKGEEPLVVFLKKFFSAGKKYGSTDRRQISHLCYCYFRLGKALPEPPMEERILTGLFLCTDSSNAILQHLKPEWNEKAGYALEEKFSFLSVEESMLPVFPWKELLSEGIDHTEFSRSFFIQPDLFLRLRPGFEERVKVKLQEGGIEFRDVDDHCLALSNSSKVDGLIELDKEAVVQDLSSQRVGQFFMSVRRDGQTGRSDRVWDCCAGSGGKSIMLYDHDPGIELTISDNRKTILINLEKRFKKAGINNYKSLTVDLSKPAPLKLSTFDFIIADVPCTGSGTWGRTPEQLYYFEEKKITAYATMQRQIVSAVIPHLETGGYFLYITCSVFKEENEMIIEFIRENFHLESVKMELLTGYREKAGTLFTALLKKVL
jgi:16S rRNA (cytosine967-C5)-methyltransferase